MTNSESNMSISHAIFRALKKMFDWASCAGNTETSSETVRGHAAASTPNDMDTVGSANEIIEVKKIECVSPIGGHVQAWQSRVVSGKLVVHEATGSTVRFSIGDESFVSTTEHFHEIKSNSVFVQ